MDIGNTKKPPKKAAPAPGPVKDEIKVPLPHPSMAFSLSKIAEGINKNDPGGIACISDVIQVPRASTGVFAIDYQTGGGWLRGRVNIVWAKEGAGKSLLCYLTVAADQIVNPTKKQVIIDIEGRLDRDWVMSLIPHPENLIVITPTTVEDSIDKAEAVLMANDLSVLIFDSIAMLITENELQSEAGKAAVGGASNPIGKLMRKLTGRLNELKKLNRHPAVILVNQVRTKIGVMHGNPDHQPGGNAPRFMSSLTLWLRGKNQQEKGSSIVNWKETVCVLHKWSTKVLALEAEYLVCTANVYDKDTGELFYKPGDIYEWPLVKSELDRLGLFVKCTDDRKGYLLMVFKEPRWYRVQDDMKTYFTAPENKLEYMQLKKALIEVATVKTHGIPPKVEA